MSQSEQLLKHASRMRHEATPFEIILWRHLSRSQLGGHKFRRQHVIGHRIVDFFCPAKGVAVEIDGDTHEGNEIAQRDHELATLGVTVIHYSNSDIANNLGGVLSHLNACLTSAPERWPHPNPSPEGEGLE
mgnify:CR=1 FL=1